MEKCKIGNFFGKVENQKIVKVEKWKIGKF